MINDWSSIDVGSSIDFILRSRVRILYEKGKGKKKAKLTLLFSSHQSYDGGFGQAPLQESHGELLSTDQRFVLWGRISTLHWLTSVFSFYLLSSFHFKGAQLTVPWLHSPCQTI